MPFLLLKKREKKVSVFSCLCVSSRRNCFLLFSAEWHVFVCVCVWVGAYVYVGLTGGVRCLCACVLKVRLTSSV